MARIYTVTSRFAEACLMAGRRAASKWEPQTVFVWRHPEGRSNVLYLVGPSRSPDEPLADTEPVFTAYPGIPDLQAKVDELRRHLHPTPERCGGCEDVGFCCFCDGEEA